ncbi:MAG: twin-arginine translocase subunit TatC [Planctomycetota bacterium]|nr:twin-arginine translocase subunit TatC [Planctomycetota bacterium]
MREVRMTFGEHLEELRRRVLFSLLYVFVGVVLALICEKKLMDITLQPHQRAFRKAQKTKLVERLNNQLRELDEKKIFIEPGAEGARFTTRDWELFFVGEVQRKNLVTQLSEPFDSFAGGLEEILPSLPPGEREQFEQAYRQQGALLAERVASHFATVNEFLPLPEIPRRFKK